MTQFSDKLKHRLVGELLACLTESKWLASDKDSATADELYEVMRRTRVAALIEFGRAVHAEMAALMDASLVTSRATALSCSAYFSKPVRSFGFRAVAIDVPQGPAVA